MKLIDGKKKKFVRIIISTVRTGDKGIGRGSDFLKVEEAEQKDVTELIKKAIKGEKD